VTRFTEDDLTCDAFLGGKLHLWQPRRGRGYRAGVDPVLLAASIEAKAGQSVLELGCGAGAAVLARRNGGAALEVVEADLTEMPLHLRQRQFDHVLANPPYFDRAASVQSRDPGRETALGEATPLRQWVRTAARRIKPKGQAHFIHRAERLPEILAALPHEMGSVEVLPLASRAGRMPELILLRARKNGRGAFRLYHSFVMHRGARHEGDGDSYVPEIEAVLRRGAPLVYPTS
jgi:tRNA1(Val) A37 N6-methylase TrmN6